MATLLITTAIAAATSFAANRIRAALTPDRIISRGRVDDLTVQSDALGTPIVSLFGRDRQAGAVIWSSGLQESVNRETQQSGGKGGGGSVTTETYLYSTSLAVALSARPIQSIGRIWADGKLLRDTNGQFRVPARLRVYRGGEDQEPDPLIEGLKGSGQTPAFRGLAYVVLEDLALAEFGNRIPILSFEVIADDGPVTSGSIMEWLLQKRNLSANVDASLNQPLTGYAVSGTEQVSQAVLDLGTLDPVIWLNDENGLVLRAPPENSPSPVSADQLGAGPGGQNQGDMIQISRPRLSARPRQIVLDYRDPARDYQNNSQRAERQAVSHDVRQTVSVNGSLSAVAAKQIASSILNDAWRYHERVQLRLPLGFAALEPGDRLTIDRGADRPVIDVQVEEVTLGAGHIALTTQLIAGSIAPPPLTADEGSIPEQSVQLSAAPDLSLLDLPLFGQGSAVEPDFDIFAALAPQPGEPWSGGNVFVSQDQGESYQFLGQARVPALMGRVQVAPGVGPSDHWDHVNSMEIVLNDNQEALESRTELAVLNGANTALVGEEILQFTDAQKQSDGAWRLSGLLRGRFGTEQAIGQQSSGDRFLILSAADLAAFPLSASARGRPVLVKAVASNQALDDSPSQSFTPMGRALLPLSPVHAHLVRTDTGDILLQWIRRTRRGSAWLDGADVPLGEQSEAYAVEFLDAGTIVADFQTSQPFLSITDVQLAALYEGPPQSVSVRLYQLSDSVGRGQVLNAHLSVPPTP